MCLSFCRQSDFHISQDLLNLANCAAAAAAVSSKEQEIVFSEWQGLDSCCLGGLADNGPGRRRITDVGVNRRIMRGYLADRLSDWWIVADVA